MAYLHACVGCRDQGASCAARDALKAKIKGLGITSLRHRCQTRVPRYAAGQSVLVLTHDGAEADEEGHVYTAWWPGWFVEQNGTRAVCFIRPGTTLDGVEFTAQHSNGFVKVPLSRVRAGGYDDVKLELCRFCNGYPALDNCWGCDPQYAGRDCLKARAPVQPEGAAHA